MVMLGRFRIYSVGERQISEPPKGIALNAGRVGDGPRTGYRKAKTRLRNAVFLSDVLEQAVGGRRQSGKFRRSRKHFTTLGRLTG